MRILILEESHCWEDLDFVSRLLLISTIVTALIAARVVWGVDGNHPRNFCLSRTHLKQGGFSQVKHPLCYIRLEDAPRLPS